MEDKNKLTTISTKISIEEKMQLAQYCAENDISIAQVIRKALRLYFSQSNI